MSEVVDCIAWIVRKTFWSLGVLLKFLGLRLLDLLGLIFNLLACCTLVRLPHMIVQFRMMSNMWEWRFVGLAQLAFFLSDIPIAIMGVFVLLTMWRVPACLSELKKAWSGWVVSSSDLCYSGWKLRTIIIKNFFKSFIDLFCLPLALVLIVSWRCVIFVRGMKKAESDTERRKVCFKEFFQLLLDIPLLLLSIPPLLSWRLPIFVYKIKKGVGNKEDWNDLRFVGVIQCFYLFLDIPSLLMFLVTLVTWRCPIMIWQLSKPEYPFYRRRQQMTIRKIVTLQFLYLFLDIPCILCLLVVLPSWRAPSLVERCRKALSKRRSKKEFYKKEMEMRKGVLVEFTMFFIDIICFVLLLVVLLTLWRTVTLVKDIKSYLKRYKGKQGHKKRMQLTGGDREENEPISPSKQQKTTYNSTTAVGETTSTSPIVGNELGEGEVEPSSINESTNADSAENQTVAEDGGTDQGEGKQPLPWSKCMWKIRKTICMHFVLLIVDLPAIPLCLFLLVTGLRTTRLISDLLGGEFYMLFAVSVYYHTLHFMIDLFFILLFLVLCLLRPIQVWVNVLEDEDHERYRKLKDIMQWIPDVVGDRHNVYRRLNDILSMSFKRGTHEYECLSKLNNEMDDYVMRIGSLLERLSRNEIEDEFVSLLRVVHYHEKQRTARMMRLFQTEQSFLRRPDTKVRAQNIVCIEREKFEYERDVRGAYEKLANYVPPRVPLYETKTGFALRSRDETKRVLIKTLPAGGIPVLMGVLLCCIPLYRAPRMIYRLVKRWYARFDILKETIYEYSLDFVTLARILFVLSSVYRAPFMVADILDCVVEKHSWRAVRKVVKRYPASILEDVINLLRVLLSWETPRFIFTALLFGLFMPADLFLTVSKSCIMGKCSGYVFSVFLYLVFMGFPFVFAFYGAEQLMDYGLGWTNPIVICVFIVLLLFVLLAMVVSLSRDSNKGFLLEMPEADYIRYNWYNFHVVAFEVLEFFQSLALVFKISPIPMYGASVLFDASKILLFSFLPFEAVFWTTVAVFVTWFFVCGAPIIFENILESSPVGKCGKRPSWRFAISLLANTLFVFFVENFASFTACRYEKCPTSVYTLGQIPTNATCRYATFVDDTSLSCWSSDGGGTHRSYAAFGMIGLVWYATTALIFDTQYGDPDTIDQDVGFSPIYNTVINILKAGTVVSVTVITNSPDAALGCLLFFNLASILFTFLFKVVFKFYPCNFASVLVWRLCTFASTCIVVVGVMVAFALDDPVSKTPLIVMGVGVLAVFVMSLAVAIKQRQISKMEKEREEFRHEIVKLEKRIVANKWFLEGWQQKGRADVWKRLIRSVRSAQKLDKSLEPKTDLVATPSMRLKNKNAVVTKTKEEFKPPPMVMDIEGTSSHSDAGDLGAVYSLPPTTERKETCSEGRASPLPSLASNKSHESSTSQPTNSETAIDDVNIGTTNPALQPTQNTDSSTSNEVPDIGNLTPPENLGQNNETSDNANQPIEMMELAPPPSTTALVQQAKSDDVIVEAAEQASPVEIGLPPPPSFEAVQNNKAFYSLHDFQADGEELLRLEKNGRNLLVALEKYVHHKAYKYSFFLQRDLWLNSAWNANWTSLLQCLRVLNANLTGDFDRPSPLDLRLAQPSVETDALGDFTDASGETPPPAFVRETKGMKVQRSRELRELALSDVAEMGGEYADKWRHIFDRVLPRNDGVIKSWTCQKLDGDLDRPYLEFELLLRRVSTGKIVGINKDDGGNKLAIGATLTVGKRLSGVLLESSLSLNDGIVGKKGPVSITVTSVMLLEKKNKTYINVSDKKVALNVAMASTDKIAWE